MSLQKAEYILRHAAQADAAAIRALTRAVRNNPVGLAWPNFWIAEDSQGMLIGCGQVKQHGDGSRELASIAVIPDWRSKGVASAIIRRLLAEHTGRLYLTCRSTLGGFYQKFGFRQAAAEELTPYFQRLKRLVGYLKRLRLLNTQETMLIMMIETESAQE